MMELFSSSAAPAPGSPARRVATQSPSACLWCLALGVWCLFGAWSLELRASERLTLADARATAIKAHPRLTAAEFKALAAKQAVLQARAGQLPTLTGSGVAVGTGDTANTRLAAAGPLSVSTVMERAGLGLNASQLLTDFGRTANQIETARQKSVAEDAGVEATRNLLLLQVSTVYYLALQSQSVLEVARQTVTTREVVLQQVSALASNQLKSALDVSFARVSVEEARLLLARAENDLESSFTALGTLLGEREPRRYELVEEPLPGELPADAAPLVADALRLRPELLRLRAEAEAAASQARADRAVNYPTVSALGSVGLLPFRDNRLEHSYAAAGMVVSLPLYSGGRDTARQRESELKAQSVGETVRDEENTVIRDVRLALLRAQHAYERLALTAKLLAYARTAYDLANARYKLGASSVAELSQAQLNLTAAEIARATARYEYLVLRAVLEFQAGRR